MSAGEEPRGYHEPVLRDVVALLFAEARSGWVIDCTVGGGGHAAAILDRNPRIQLLGIDRDVEALDAAGSRLGGYADRARLASGRFDDLRAIAEANAIDEASGVLFDLGVSSHQLDTAERGFSHRFEAPLDMRMDRSTGRTAADVVNGTTEDELVAILRDGGETRFARRIARSLLAARPVETTTQLAEIVRAAIPAPARRRGGDPANRAFQAIRIAVNDELAVLETGLDHALDLLAPGGRLVVLSYHSGEDRIVKGVFGRSTRTDDAPPGLPVMPVDPPDFRLVRGVPRTAPSEEVAANRRAAPVRLRAIERVAP